MVPRPQGYQHHESFLGGLAGEEGLCLNLQAPEFAPTATTNKMTKRCRDKLVNMCLVHGPRLNSIAAEFTRLEAELAPDVHALLPSNQSDDTVAKLARLQFFIAHVEHTRERMEAAREGRDEPFTMRQLTLLERHITTALLPVMDRLETQRRLNIAAAAAAAAEVGAAGATGAAAAAAANPAPPAATGLAGLPGYGDVDRFLVSDDKESTPLLLLEGPIPGHNLHSLSTPSDSTLGCSDTGMSSNGAAASLEAEEGRVWRAVDLGAASEPYVGRAAAPAAAAGTFAAAVAAAAAAAAPAAASSLLGEPQAFPAVTPAAGTVGTGVALPAEGSAEVLRRQQQHQQLAYTGASLGLAANVFSYDGARTNVNGSGGESGLVCPLALLQPTPINRDSSGGGGSSSRSSGSYSVVEALEAMDFEDKGPRDASASAARTGGSNLKPLPLRLHDSAALAAAPAMPQLGPSPMAVEDAVVAPPQQQPAMRGLEQRLPPMGAFDDSAAATAVAAAAAAAPAAAAAAAAVPAAAAAAAAIPVPAAAAPLSFAVKRKAEADPAGAPAHFLAAAAAAGPASAGTAQRASGSAAGASATAAAAAARTAAAAAAAAAIGALYLAAGVAPEATVSYGNSAPAGAAVAGAGTPAAGPPRRAKRRLLPPALTAPRAVHFQCAACSEVYPSTISFNPWWALFQQQCPVCCNVQVPRVDINHPANNNDTHMAVLSAAADADCDSGNDSGGDSDSDSGSDAEDNEDGGAGGVGFGGQPVQPVLPAEQAAKLLVLMCHARTCPGVHSSARHQEVCKSIKFLMLHIRDCDGRLATGDACPCPYPWCEPCKVLLQHLLQCDGGDSCAICCPSQLPQQLQELRAVAAARNAAVAAAAAPAVAPLAAAAAAAAAPMLLVPKVEAVPATAMAVPPPPPVLPQ